MNTACEQAEEKAREMSQRAKLAGQGPGTRNECLTGRHQGALANHEGDANENVTKQKV